PLRASDQFAVHLKSRRGASWNGDAVNRDLLAQMIGVRSDSLRAGVPKVDSIVDAAVWRGQTVVGGLCQISSALSWHDDRIVVSARPGTDPVIDAGQEIDSLIKTLNVAAKLGLLENIPDGAPIRPHRFRRTFAITARKYPWLQIAL